MLQPGTIPHETQKVLIPRCCCVMPDGAHTIACLDIIMSSFLVLIALITSLIDSALWPDYVSIVVGVLSIAGAVTAVLAIRRSKYILLIVYNGWKILSSMLIIGNVGYLIYIVNVKISILSESKLIFSIGQSCYGILFVSFNGVVLYIVHYCRIFIRQHRQQTPTHHTRQSHKPDPGVVMITPGEIPPDQHSFSFHSAQPKYVQHQQSHIHQDHFDVDAND